MIVFGAGLYFSAEKILSIYADNQENQLLAKRYQTFADQCLQNTDSSDHSQVLVELRHCLHMNSQHKIDDAFYKLVKGGNIAFANAVTAYANGKRETKPHMECSRRSVFLNNMYLKLGYNSRIVIVVKKKEKFPDHVYVEVLNPDTNLYEVQDPKYDVYFKSLVTNKRLDTKALLQNDFGGVVPCGYNDQCTWMAKAPDGRSPRKTIQPFLTMAYLNEYDDSKDGPLLYNPSRLDPFKKITYQDGRQVSYCDKRAHQCKNVVDVTKE